MKSKFNKTKMKNSTVDARLTNNYSLFSEEHIREAERFSQKANKLTKDLNSMNNELDKATKQYRVLTEKVATVSREHPVPGHENLNLVKLEQNQERMQKLIYFLVYFLVFSVRVTLAVGVKLAYHFYHSV